MTVSLLGAALEISLEHLEESHSKLSIRKCVGKRVAAAVQVAPEIGSKSHTT